MLHTYIYHLTTLHITYLPDIRTNFDVSQSFAVFLYYMLNIWQKCLTRSGSRRKNVLWLDQSDVVPARNSTSTHSGTISDLERSVKSQRIRCGLEGGPPVTFILLYSLEFCVNCCFIAVTVRKM